MEQLEAHKSAFSDISAMELGNSISARTGPRLQILYRLLCLRAHLYGTHVSRTYIYAFSVRISEICPIISTGNRLISI